VKFPSEVLVNRSQKETVVDEIREIFNNAAAGVLVDYRGLEAKRS
jgi:ribosomal protein L10